MSEGSLYSDDGIDNDSIDVTCTGDCTILSVTYEASDTSGSPNDGFKADGDGWYDILVVFSDPLEEGDTAMLTFTFDFLDGERDDITNFLIGSEMDDGTETDYITAAHVQGIGEDGEFSGWMAGVDDGDLPSIVPIPAAAWLLGSALVGLLGVSRIKRRKAHGTA